jgi:manganese transport protein
VCRFFFSGQSESLHGHRFFGDLFHGSTINEVRHLTHIPIFLVRAEKK